MDEQRSQPQSEQGSWRCRLTRWWRTWLIGRWRRPGRPRSAGNCGRRRSARSRTRATAKKSSPIRPSLSWLRHGRAKERGGGEGSTPPGLCRHGNGFVQVWTWRGTNHNLIHTLRHTFSVIDLKNRAPLDPNRVPPLPRTKREVDDSGYREICVGSILLFFFNHYWDLMVVTSVHLCMPIRAHVGCLMSAVWI